MKVRLHDFYQGGLQKLCICSHENGKGCTNVNYVFEPGTTYEFNDPILIQFFKGTVGDIREHLVSTPALVEQLKYYQVPYEVRKCGTCASAKPHIWFNPFKIVEE